MIYYATFNENGNYTGFYTKEIHGDNIPTPTVELTVEQWQEATTGKYKLIDGVHTHNPPTQEQLDAKELTIARSKRNDLLRESDWTQLPNNPLPSEKQEEWAVYRQQLRDIPETIPYVFPTPPL
jgi:hypothetical protein